MSERLFRGKIFLLAVLLVAACARPHPRAPATGTRHVWIDTDPSVGVPERDVDDGFALIQAFHSPELRVVGVSVVFGNAPLGRAYPIAREITSRFGPAGLRVYAGADAAADLGRETPASRALESALRARPLVVLALGPATNVATVVMNHPELTEHIVEVVAVAGRRPGQRFTTGTTNPKAHRDFNFELDAKAFEILLASRVPLTLAPFELSSKVWIRDEDLSRLASGGPAARYLADPARGWLGLWKQTFGVDGFNPFDTLAVAVVATPSLVQCEILRARIETLPDDATEERMQGTKSLEKPYLLVAKALAPARDARYCHTLAMGYKDDLLHRLLGGD
jgi:pyrimidine-specific ribonucleoside hydrolase